MKLVKLKCENCGAILKVEPESTDIHCEHCQANYKLDDEAQHIKYDDMEKAGYDYEKGRLKAREEHEEEKKRQQVEAQQAALKAERDAKNRKWIILAWIFLFPYTLTWWIWAKSTLSKRAKIIVTALLWGFFLIVGLSSQGENKNMVSVNSQSDSSQVFERFVERYNEIGDDKIVDLMDYDVKDENAAYYQTEFRLASYDDASAKLGKIGYGRILLVNDKGFSGGNDFRVYAFVGSREESNIVAHSIIKAIDPTVLDEDINKAITDDYVNEILYGDIGALTIDSNNKVLVVANKALFTEVLAQDDKSVAMRKCTVMEAADIVSTGIGKKTKDVFYDAKNTCESFFNGGTAESFYEAIDIDWGNRANEQIDGKSLSYYTDKLGW